MIEVLVLLLVAAVVAMTERPNVVLVLADDVGFGDVGFTNRGTNLAKTPVLDALATGKGTWVLDQMHSEAACSPSRLAILTARSPMRDCVVGSPVPNRPMFPASTQTVVHLAKQLGYRTLFLGKFLPKANHSHSPSTEWPSQLGFENWTAIEGGSTYDFTCVCQQLASGECFLGHETVPSLTRFLRLCSAKASPDDRDAFPPQRVMESDHLASLFHTWLEAVPEHSNFFAQISFRSVHVPFVASPELRLECASGRICNPTLRPKSSIQLDYAGCIHAMDLAVGRIRQSIVQLRPRDHHNTIFVFLSDNGPAPVAGIGGGAGSNGGQTGTKGSLFEGLLRVPALLEWPKVIARQQTVRSLVSILDLPATIAHAISGQELDPDHHDGWSFLPQLVGNQASFVRRGPLAVCAYSNAANVRANVSCKQVAVVGGAGRWKLVGTRERTANSISSFDTYDLRVGEFKPAKPVPRRDELLVLAANRWLASVFAAFQERCGGYLSN